METDTLWLKTGTNWIEYWIDSKAKICFAKVYKFHHPVSCDELYRAYPEIRESVQWLPAPTNAQAITVEAQ